MIIQLPPRAYYDSTPDRPTPFCVALVHEAQGFLVFRSYLTLAEIGRYSDEFDAGMAASNQTLSASGRQYAGMMGENTPFMAELATDPRFAEVAEQLIGSRNPWCIACDGNRHVGATEW